MERCPICRALLNGADACRRCRSELAKVREIERRGQEIAGAAMHRLALSGVAEAARLLRRARAIHATPEVRTLSRTDFLFMPSSRTARLRNRCVRIIKDTANGTKGKGKDGMIVRVKQAKRSVKMNEICAELTKLALRLGDDACNLGALRDQRGQNVALHHDFPRSRINRG